jgi:hypothetical protein
MTFLKRSTPPRKMSPKTEAKRKSAGEKFIGSTIAGPRKQVKRRNAKRKASEFARCYGSRARVQFVKALPCCYCNALSTLLGDVTKGRCDNAHTENGGMGRKAGYATIVPLCRNHHKRFDEHREPFDAATIRKAVQRYAAVVEDAWQELAGRGVAQGEA